MSEWVEPIWQSIRSVLANVPDYIGEFFKDNKKPLVTLGLILAGFVTVKVTLAVLEAIGDIPLLAPLLQLIGIAYTAWFVYRYLWKASSRQELVAEIDAIKTQIFGHDTLSS
jgi:heme A synthase